MDIQEYLHTIDKVIEGGKFKDNTQSLLQFKIPKWYSEGRFGLFIHWGVYSVPEFKSEWYPRMMYLKGNPCFEHRQKTYGENADYRQIVGLFKPQKFDAEKWLALFKESGARYIMPVGEHHDGIKMYKSELNPWNTYDLNGRDYLSELHAAADRYGLGFLTSSHRAEHYWFLNGARKNCPDSEVTKNLYPELYGPATEENNKGVGGDRDLQVSKEWLEDWLASSCEMIDVNKPLAVYFDWWIQNKSFKPYIQKFLAYYYNRGIEWGKEVAVFYKLDSMEKGTAIFDVERGQIDGISPVLWQCDTSTAKNSWGYTKDNIYKTPFAIAVQLIDVIAKNGCFMLNIGPRADGSICDEDGAILKRLGSWLKIHGSAIYDAKPYKVYGEGIRKKFGGFRDEINYTIFDYRFTAGDGFVNVFPMGEKPRKSFVVFSLGSKKLNRSIDRIELLGSGVEVTFKQTPYWLSIKLGAKLSGDMPLCFRVYFK